MVRFSLRSIFKGVVVTSLYRVYFENGKELVVEADHDPDYGFDSWPVWSVGTNENIVVNPEKILYVVCLGEVEVTKGGSENDSATADSNS
jgi:hypothetical protein